MWNNHISSLKRINIRHLQWGLVKPWIGVAGLVGLGILPCPDCGAPMIIHFWPIAAIVALRNILRNRKNKLTLHNELPSNEEDLSFDLEIKTE